jgi:hypothetical protein
MPCRDRHGKNISRRNMCLGIPEVFSCIFCQKKMLSIYKTKFIFHRINIFSNISCCLIEDMWLGSVGETDETSSSPNL